MKKRRRKSRKGSIGSLPIPGVDLQRVAAVTGGAVAAKMVNPVATKLLDKYLPAGNPNAAKYARAGVSGAKILVGGYLQTQKSQMAKDAGIGIMSVGGLELVEIFVPQVKISGLLDDAETIGNVVEIDLDQLNGFDNDLESFQEVAGITDDYVAEEMELAGMYDEYYEDGSFV